MCLWSDQLQVLGIDAQSVVAHVVHHAVGYRFLVHQCPQVPMSRGRLVVGPYDWVSGAVDRPRPDMTLHRCVAMGRIPS